MLNIEMLASSNKEELESEEEFDKKRDKPDTRSCISAGQRGGSFRGQLPFAHQIGRQV